MKLLFLLLLCVLILARSARSPSFDVRLHGSWSIPIASFVEHGLFIKTFCHRKYLNRRIVYSSGHQGTFNPVVMTNKEVHMAHGKITTRLHIPLVMKRRDLLKFLITFPNKMVNLLYLVSKLCIIFVL